MNGFNSHSNTESISKTLSGIRPGSQKGRILSRLRTDYPEWTPAYKLRNPDGLGEILQQNARVWELKHVHFIVIENREQRVNGVCHSSYRLCQNFSADKKPQAETSQNPTPVGFLFSAPDRTYAE
jgi:hypothetical protein